MLHTSNGLYFKRLANGDVYICKKTDSSEDAVILFEQIVNVDTWASVVSHVSHYKKTNFSFEIAKMFHMGERL